MVFSRLEIEPGREVRRRYAMELPCRCRISLVGGLSGVGFAVEARREDGARRFVKVEPGRSATEPLPPGSWSFRVILGSRGRRAVVSKEDVSVVLKPGGEAAVRLALAPLATATVTFAEGVEVHGVSWRLEIGEGADRFVRRLLRFVPAERTEDVIVPAGRRRWRVVGLEGVRYDEYVDVAEGGRHRIVIE